jgi:hypothetical protein
MGWYRAGARREAAFRRRLRRGSGARLIRHWGLKMLQDVIQYLSEHPTVLASIGVFVLLAAVGAWYVLAHHLHALLITLLCVAGFASGFLVFYRGYQLDMRDLMAVGLFLILIFPVIFQQAIRVARIAFGVEPAVMSRGHARRARV